MTDENAAQKTAVAVKESTRVASSQVRQSIAKIAKKYSDIKAIATKTDYDFVKGGIRECREKRGAVTEIHKEEKADILAAGRRLDADKNEIIALLTEIETPLKEIKRAYDDKKEREREVKRQIEVDRVNLIQNKIAAFMPSVLPNWESGEYTASIEALKAHEVTEDEYQEFFEVATRKKAEALDALQKGLEARVEFENEQAKLEAQRKHQDELARQHLRKQTAMDAIAEINTRISDSLSYSLESLKGALTSLGNLQITEEVFFDRIPEAESVKAKALEHFEKLIVQKKAEAKAAAENEAERKRLSDLAEKQEEERIEDKRRLRLANAQLNEIVFPLQNIGKFTVYALHGAIAALQGRHITEDRYYTKVEEATKLKASTLEQLKDALEQKEKIEAEEKRLLKEKLELEAQQKAEVDRKEAEERERVRNEDEAAAKLKKEKEAKEEAERLERLRPDREKMSNYAVAIQNLLLAAPKVEENEACLIMTDVIVRLTSAKRRIEDAINPGEK
jgi:hypothetical protein